jgi:hypothetical protein
MWKSAEFPELRALSIPHHGGEDIKPRTVRSILDQLHEDIFAWEERLSEDMNGDDGGDNGAG